MLRKDELIKVAITITTINTPVIIEKLYTQIIENFSVTLIIIGDIKSPITNVRYCEKYRKENFEIKYFTIEDQYKYFFEFEELLDHLPLNSFSRRNLGDLFAIMNKYDYIIKIDDDNFPIDNNFILDHINSFNFTPRNTLTTDNGWFNVCQTLTEKSMIPFYPRGFPYSYRWQGNTTVEAEKITRIGVNAGLWVGDPDIDALTRLTFPIQVTGFEEKLFGPNFVLSQGTWAPINTQNTCFNREFSLISFVSPYVGRFDDIFSGYILRKIADRLQIGISYGKPIVNQKRNLHDIWKDENSERFGNTIGEKFILELKKVNLSNSSPLSCYEEIILHFRDSSYVNFIEIKQMLDGMQIWLNCMNMIEEFHN
jgi:hypothetical protein